MNKRALLCVSSLAGVLGLSAAVQPALAQDAAAPRVAVLEEVIITAERREQNLQDVPLSATALTGAALQERGVENVTDLSKIAPSVSVQASQGINTQINIRGAGSQQLSPSATGGVAYYIDGVFLASDLQIAGSFYDVDSVEVYRGPQGTLVGQNSTGGAIFVRSRAPDLEKFGGSIQQTIGNYNWLRTEAAVNIPFSDKLALRLATVYEKRDSFTRNIGPSGDEPGNVDGRAFRANLEYRPTDNLTVNLRADFNEDHTDDVAMKPYGDPISPDPYVVAYNARSKMDREAQRYAVEMNYDLFSRARLRLISSKQRFRLDNIGETDFGLGPVSFVKKNNIDAWTHEINLVSTGDGPLQWVVGGFYFDQDQPGTIAQQLLFGFPIFNVNATFENTSKSVFGQASYAFNPQWELVIGARRTSDEQSYKSFIGGPPALASSDADTGKVALNWHPNADTLVYGSVTKGYKAGGTNTNGQAYGPEENTVSELGLKTTVLDGRLRLSSAIYHSNYENIQLVTFGPNGFPAAVNAGAATYDGAELEAVAVFGAMSADLGVSYLKSETSDPITLLDNLAFPFPANATVAAGAELAYAPEWTLNAGVQYDISVGSGTLTPRLQVSYLADQWNRIFQTAQDLIPARTLWDFRLTYRMENGALIEGFVTNIADETYVAGIFTGSPIAPTGFTYGSPRQYGVRLSAEF